VFHTSHNPSNKAKAVVYLYSLESRSVDKSTHHRPTYCPGFISVAKSLLTSGLFGKAGWIGGIFEK
jgi:hypothetical protein